MNGAAIFTEIMESRLPIFEVTEAGGHKYQIFLDGRTKGFGSNAYSLNWAKQVINVLKTELHRANQKAKSLSSPMVISTESDAGISHDVAL
jgi:hypothetical protein